MQESYERSILSDAVVAEGSRSGGLGRIRNRLRLPWRLRVAAVLLLCTTCKTVCQVNLSVVVGDLYASKQSQGILLGAYYWGYAVAIVPAGVAASRWGPKLVLCSGAAIWVGATLLLPMVAGAPAPGRTANATYGLYTTVASRVMVGVGGGANYPPQVILAQRWFPPSERSRLWAIVTGGEQLGTVLVLLLGPLLAPSSANLVGPQPLGGTTTNLLSSSASWHKLFYLSGAFAVLNLLLLVFTLADSPEKHRCVAGTLELQYILREREPVDTSGAAATSSPPWRRILRCTALWATLATSIAYEYGYYMALSWTDVFFIDVFHLRGGSLAAVTIWPSMVMFATISLGGAIADKMTQRGIPLVVVRKTLNTTGLLIGALCFALLPSVALPPRSSIVGAEALFICAVASGGLLYSGYWANYTDLSPTYTSVLLALCEGVAAMSGVVGQFFTGALLNNDEDGSQSSSSSNWDRAFLLVALIYIMGGMVFLAFGKASPQF